MQTKILIGILIVAVLLIEVGIVMAHENFNETKKLIDSNISCNKLSNEQLNEIGDYYMEQMHPGEAHELMHNMMGGENSETTKLMHINMAKSIYCGETDQSMMGMVGGMMGNNMMRSGMMNMMSGGMMGGSHVMMGNWGYGFVYWNFLNILYVILIIGLIVLIYLAIIKQWKNTQNKR